MLQYIFSRSIWSVIPAQQRSRLLKLQVVGERRLRGCVRVLNPPLCPHEAVRYDGGTTHRFCWLHHRRDSAQEKGQFQIVFRLHF